MGGEKGGRVGGRRMARRGGLRRERRVVLKKNRGRARSPNTTLPDEKSSPSARETCRNKRGGRENIVLKRKWRTLGTTLVDGKESAQLFSGGWEERPR